MKKRRWILLFPSMSILVLSSLFAQEPKTTRFSRPLPKVLLIGDSISIGYMPYVAEMLKGRATVTHNEGNAQHTGTGLQLLDQWVGKTKWDVIHFNWGLWDLCYRHPESKAQGNRDKLRGTVAITLDQYGRNLEQLVQRLEKTGATLIWAQTTVVPEGEAGRIVGDDLRYNEVAAGIMARHGIRIDDLYSLTRGFSRDLFVGYGDVHYRNEGYKKIASRVSENIRSALNSERANAEIPADKSKACSAAEVESKAGQLVEGSRWDATATINQTPITAVVTVSRPGDTTATLTVDYDNGAIWIFECDFNGQSLTVKHAERRKVADINAGKTNLPPVANTRGSGTVRQDKLTLNYIVPGPTGQTALDVRIKAELRK